MLDQYNRNIEYVRISITDRCNLRCTYCMPETGIEQVPHTDILTYDEILRICRIMSEMGISKVKVTGGEPLIRKNAPELIREIRKIPGIDNVTLTTNGILLKEQIQELADAGLDAVNISLDALDEKLFEKITRRTGLRKVLEGIDAELAYSRIRVKVNCVLLEGINEEQWMPMAGLAKDRDIDVRFIEMMPIGYGKDYGSVTETRIRHMLTRTYGNAEELKGKFGNGPCTYIKLPGFQGKIGFISAVSHKFCSTCNRVRLTSEGFLKLCLQYSSGVDLREPLRSGSTDGEIAGLIEKAIYDKPRSHHFEIKEQDGFEAKKMSQIGG